MPGQVQEGSGKVPVQRGSIDRSGRRWWRARRGSTRFRKVPEKQVQRRSGKGSGEGSGEALARTRFRKVSEKVSGDVGARPGQVQ